jgi:hypothetical protein
MGSLCTNDFLFDKPGLVTRFDATTRLWVDTGAVNIPISNPTNALDLSYNNTNDDCFCC